MPVATQQLDAEQQAAAQQEQHSQHLALSPEEQQNCVWKELKAASSSSASGADAPQQPQRAWPAYDEVLNHLGEADYTETLTCPYDVIKTAGGSSAACPGGGNLKSKTLCPHGVICKAVLEIFPHSTAGYTGLLQANKNAQTASSFPCILRLSSAMKPPSLGVQSKWARAALYATGEKIRKAKLFPCAALKVFRSDNMPSGNLLFGGSKVGQREHDYFAHCLCTSMTEQMPRGVRPFVRKFWTYSDYPLSLGVSDFCRPSQEDAGYCFPFAVILCPRTDGSHHAPDSPLTNNDTFEDSFDEFLDRAQHIPPGTVLYDVFACPEPQDVPDSSKLQRIGRITTASEMIQSSSTDGLFFRHQKKEQDYALRPSWPAALKAKVTINQGATTDTIGKLAGWKLFEQHIADGTYVDFEQPAREE